MFLLDFKGGKVLQNDLGNDPLDLKEDLLQVEYSNSLSSSAIVDLGWYEIGDNEGEFVIFVIVGNDWDNPVDEISFKQINDLKYHLDKAIALALTLTNN